MLIYQVDNGAGNGGKLPSGGVLYSATLASSMSAVVANPITLYGGDLNPAVNQAGQSGDLYNYYWTSYSRGTDGQWDDYNWHNLYLDSYIPLRHKSIYDPCPYGYRIPSNGTYNQFTNTAWTLSSYAGGTVWRQSWFGGLGRRYSIFSDSGYQSFLLMSTIYNSIASYSFLLRYNQIELVHSNTKSNAHPVRCIEECEILTDATEAKASYRQHSGKP